jgi:rhodanese-related sulfurtransferase
LSKQSFKSIINIRRIATYAPAYSKQQHNQTRMRLQFNNFFIAMLFILFGFATTSCDAQVKSKVELKDAFLVDVRTPGEFAGGSAEGAINIPLNEIPNRIAEFKGKENIVVFCKSGGRSSQAKSILENNGITNITNGGTWQDVQRALAKK